MDAFQYQGVWWLPEDPANKIAGILKFDPPEFPRLELIGAFQRYQDFPTRTKIILGVTSKATQVTLYDCLEVSRPSAWSSSHPFSQIYSNFTADVAFLGGHFQNEEEILFDSIEVNYANLEEWSQIPTEGGGLEKEEAGLKLNIPFMKGATANLDGFSLSLRHDLVPYLNVTEQLVKLTTRISVIPKQRLSFSDYWERFLHKIGIFLSMGMGRATFPLSITGRTQTTEFPVSIFYPAFTESGEQSKKLYKHRMLFTFEDIVENFEEYLKNWFDKSETLEPVYNLYAGTLYMPTMYAEQKFLSLIQAIEVFHRRMRGGQYVDEDAFGSIYDHLVSQIPSKVDETLKQQLKNSLFYANRFNLRRRLTAIWKEHQAIIKRLIPNRAAFDGFSDNVVCTRNFLTHYDQNTRCAPKTDLTSLLNFSLRLRFLIEVCLLTEIGIPSSVIMNLMKRNPIYRPDATWS